MASELSSNLEGLLGVDCVIGILQEGDMGGALRREARLTVAALLSSHFNDGADLVLDTVEGSSNVGAYPNKISFCNPGFFFKKTKNLKNIINLTELPCPELLGVELGFNDGVHMEPKNSTIKFLCCVGKGNGS